MLVADRGLLQPLRPLCALDSAAAAMRLSSAFTNALLVLPSGSGHSMCCAEHTPCTAAKLGVGADRIEGFFVTHSALHRCSSAEFASVLICFFGSVCVPLFPLPACIELLAVDAPQQGAWGNHLTVVRSLLLLHAG